MARQFHVTGPAEKVMAKDEFGPYFVKFRVITNKSTKRRDKRNKIAKRSRAINRRKK